MATGAANDVYSVSPVGIATGEPHSNLNPGSNMNDSGICSESESPFSSDAQMTVTSSVGDEHGRISFGMETSAGDTFQSCDAILESSNTIQQAFFLAESSLTEMDNVVNAAPSQISSNSTEQSGDTEKMFNMIITPQLNLARQPDSDGSTPQFQQLQTLDPNYSGHVVSGENTSDMAWFGKSAIQQPELMKFDNKYIGCSTAQSVGLSGGQNTASLIQVPMGHVPHHSQVPVMNSSEQLPASKVPNCNPFLTAADPLLQRHEQEIQIKLAQGSLHPTIQANVMDLWRSYRHRTLQTGHDLLSTCAAPLVGTAVTSCMMNLIKAQHCLVGEFVVALLDEILIRSALLPKLDGNPPYPIPSYGSSGYGMFSYSPRDLPSYQHCVQVPVTTVNGQVPRLHIISPVETSSAESGYSSECPPADCHAKKQNQCYSGVYPKYSKPICANSPEACTPFLSDFNSSCHQVAHGQHNAVAPLADQETSVLKCCPSSPGRGSRKLKPEATDIMNRWYYEHLRHPYPNPDTTEKLAKACHITVDQVKKWFANKRMRTRNTKSLHEIALARRKLENEALVNHVV